MPSATFGSMHLRARVVSYVQMLNDSNHSVSLSHLGWCHGIDFEGDARQRIRNGCSAGAESRQMESLFSFFAGWLRHFDLGAGCRRVKRFHVGFLVIGCG